MNFLSCLNKNEVFAENPNQDPPQIIYEVIDQIAKTGIYCYSWQSLRCAIISLIDQTLNIKVKAPNDATMIDLERRKASVYNLLTLFEAAPFTIQRICEIIVSRGAEYCSLDKLLNAFEKLI